MANSSGIDEGPHRTDRLVHSGEDRAAHDAVADVELLDVGEGCHRLDIEIGQPVTRVHGQAQRPGVPRRELELP